MVDTKQNPFKVVVCADPKSLSEALNRQFIEHGYQPLAPFSFQAYEKNEQGETLAVTKLAAVLVSVDSVIEVPIETPMPAAVIDAKEPLPTSAETKPE
jgi:hypothetical protein